MEARYYVRVMARLPPAEPAAAWMRESVVIVRRVWSRSRWKKPVSRHALRSGLQSETITCISLFYFIFYLYFILLFIINFSNILENISHFGACQPICRLCVGASIHLSTSQDLTAGGNHRHHRLHMLCWYIGGSPKAPLRNSTGLWIANQI